MIPMPLMTLNQYVDSERGSLFGGARIKKQATDTAAMFVQRAMMNGVKFDWGKPLRFDWYWHDRRTDPDNIAFQHKFVFDGMMVAGFLTNDNWDNIVELRDRFFIDKANPRVEVYELDD
ncbi:endodeoxyribonuclease [Lacticaseibacillus sp. 866-1]|uniref:endodeoxyribonuclease n=1 Tax=Lacticaseibacillus sp. 866-1 TaxID=2799576 RepID=UPI0019411A6C|nr:endodeoxyribonuclease [Lacticaseibacillus sp. 866-1]